MFKGGNLFNKYTSKNPFVKILMTRFFNDIDTLLKNKDIKSILDVGCGEGYVTQHIYNLKPQSKIKGIDLYEDVITTAKKLHPDITFSTGSIYNIQEEDNRYTLVIASEVLEHLENPKQALNELKRVSDKYCLLTVPREPYFRLANMLRFKYITRFGNTPGHIQNWTQSAFKNLLKTHFSCVTVKMSTLWQIALCKR